MYWERKDFFDLPSEMVTETDENFISQDFVIMIINCVAGWMSEQIADDDLMLWTEINNVTH